MKRPLLALTLLLTISIGGCQLLKGATPEERAKNAQTIRETGSALSGLASAIPGIGVIITAAGLGLTEVLALLAQREPKKN